MAYIDVISLADAKTYLGIDDTSRDAEITRMIGASLSMIENQTNHIMFQRSKTYLLLDGCVMVYDYPINALTSPTTAVAEQKPLYSIYTEDDLDETDLVLDVGYATPALIPNDLIEAAYMLLKFFFYEQENHGKLPMMVNHLIGINRRFVI